MLFTSLTFIIFHVVVVALRWALPRRASGIFLLVSSYVFYLSWEPKYGLLISSMTLVTWLAALGIERRRTQGTRALLSATLALLFQTSARRPEARASSHIPRDEPARPAPAVLSSAVTRDARDESALARRQVDGRNSRHSIFLAVVIAALLLVLAYFKYANFLTAQWATLLSHLGLHPHVGRFDVVLPLAISFYTFELISYVIDVSRGEAAEGSLLRFALYVSYYPHLIAGPIVRAHELLPSLRAPKRFDGDLFAEGVFIALVGYVKKSIFADNFAPWSDAVFAAPDRYSTFGVWMGVLAYTAQIYCDFSGYTDIARGASLMLGYELPENFDYPYLSKSPTEFWRRWHQTLSRWLRDYLYISLGGNRRGTVRQYVNLLATMVLGGLWHGASWTFVVWGTLHGVALALHKAWDSLLSRVPWTRRVRESLPYATVAWAATLVAVMIGWVCFRAPTFERAAQVLARMFVSVPGMGELAAPALPKPLSLTLTLAVLLAAGHVAGRYRAALTLHRKAPAPLRGAIWAALVAACFLFAESRAEFIYFQF